MNGISWPYLAAMYDGDGTFSIGKNTGRGRIEYALLAPIYNTSLPLMNWLKEHFGGNVNKVTATKFTKQTCYKWSNLGHSAQRWILSGILPYLVVKSRQAELALKFIDLHCTVNQEERERLYQEMKRLNSDVSLSYHPEKYGQEDEYLAGILDAEGSIVISRPVGYSPRLEVKVHNSDFNLIQWCHHNFGGRYCLMKHDHKRDAYYWYPSGKKNKEQLLLQLIPHMIVKKEQAKLALCYLRTGDASLADPISSLNHGLSPEANMSGVLSCNSTKIESELHGDMQSAPVVTLDA